MENPQENPDRAELVKHIENLRVLLDSYYRREQEYFLDPLQQADKRRAEIRLNDLSNQLREIEKDERTY